MRGRTKSKPNPPSRNRGKLLIPVMAVGAAASIFSLVKLLENKPPNVRPAEPPAPLQFISPNQPTIQSPPRIVLPSPRPSSPKRRPPPRPSLPAAPLLPLLISSPVSLLPLFASPVHSPSPILPLRAQLAPIELFPSSPLPPPLSDEYLINHAKQEWQLSLKHVPLTEEACAHVIEWSLLGQVPSLAYLYICMNTPPCDKDKGEEEKTTNSRTWCKGRKVPTQGTTEFEQVAREVLAKYQEREIAQAPPELKQELKEELSFLESLQLRISDLTYDPKDIELRERYDALVADSDLEDFQTGMNAAIDAESTEKGKQDVRKSISRSIQNQKIKSSSGNEVLTIVKKTTKQVADDIKEARKTNEKVATSEQFNAGIAKILERMDTSDQNVDRRLTALERQNVTLDAKQDLVLKTTQDIRGEQELQKYIDVWYKSKWGVVKKILSAPLQALNIIFWKPAKYAFWRLFGNYFYLAWGLFSLFLILLLTLAVGHFSNTNYPEITTYLYDAAISLWGLTLRHIGNVFEWLNPYFGKGFMVLLQGAKASVVAVLQGLWDLIIGQFISAVKHAIWG